MPNHVQNKIEFNATEKQAEAIFNAIKSNERDFDFSKLIPFPIYMYKADTSTEDNEDFPCNWYNWNLEHWGTKWNAYDAIVNYKEGIASIEFSTAWSIPYPVIIAFGNSFKVNFKFIYYEEFESFYGIENYKVQDSFIKRTLKRRNNPEDLEFIRNVFGIENEEDDE